MIDEELIFYLFISDNNLLFTNLLQLVNAPSAAVAAPSAKNKVPQVEAAATDDTGIDSELQARLDNLRKM